MRKCVPWATLSRTKINGRWSGRLMLVDCCLSPGLAQILGLLADGTYCHFVASAVLTSIHLWTNQSYSRKHLSLITEVLVLILDWNAWAYTKINIMLVPQLSSIYLAPSTHLWLQSLTPVQFSLWGCQSKKGRLLKFIYVWYLYCASNGKSLSKQTCHLLGTKRIFDFPLTSVSFSLTLS